MSGCECVGVKIKEILSNKWDERTGKKRKHEDEWGQDRKGQKQQQTTRTGLDLAMTTVDATEEGDSGAVAGEAAGEAAGDVDETGVDGVGRVADDTNGKSYGARKSMNTHMCACMSVHENGMIYANKREVRKMMM